MRKLSYLNFVAAPLCALMLIGCNSDSSVEKSSELNASFLVERNKTDKVYTLNIEGDGHWQVFAGESIESIDTNIVIIEGNGSKEVNLTNFPTDKRIYFQYVLENSTKIIASERLLPMEGAYNVRDTGGYKTVDGKTVKWGKVFRSGDLNQLTSNDIDYLENIGIKTVVDFRTNNESEAAPDKILKTVTNILKYPIGKEGPTMTEQQMIDMAATMTIETSKQSLINSNKNFVINHQNEYKKFFEVLMNDNNLPLLFHCTAGKDRAGFATALFLSALGVDKETVIEDYLLSGIYREEKLQEWKGYPTILPLMTVYREYIEAAFDTIDNEYGGIESYLQNELGVDLELMRGIYTE
jgi:protein-tyrosine phosphatase